MLATFHDSVQRNFNHFSWVHKDDGWQVIYLIIIFLYGSEFLSKKLQCYPTWKLADYINVPTGKFFHICFPLFNLQPLDVEGLFFQEKWKICSWHFTIIFNQVKRAFFFWIHLGIQRNKQLFCKERKKSSLSFRAEFVWSFWGWVQGSYQFIELLYEAISQVIFK